MPSRMKRDLMQGIFDAILVLTALLCSLLCFADLIPEEIGMDVAPACLMAVLAGLVALIVCWQPRRRPLWVAGYVSALVLAGAAFFRILLRGAVVLGCAVSQVYAENVPGFDQLYPLEAMTPEQASQAATACLQFIVAVAALLVAWAVARRRSFWQVLFYTLPTVLLPVIVMHTPPLVPLLGLIGCWLVLLAARAGRADRFSSAKMGLIAMPVVAAFLCFTYLLVPLQGYQRSPRVESLRMAFNSFVEGDTINALALPFASTNGRTDLSSNGSLHFTGETALRVYSERREKTYLKGFSAEVYTGDSWRQTPARVYEQAMGDADFAPMNLMSDVMRSNLPQVEPFHMEITLLRPNGAYLYAPYGLTTREGQLSETRFVRDSYIRVSARSQTFALDTMGLSSLSEPLSTPDSLRYAENLYSQYVRQTCLDVDEDLAQWLRQLAAENGVPDSSQADWQTVVESTAAFIRGAARYDAAPGLTPDGEDYVQYFLGENKRGYCMHFASAGTLMLRALGVPARYVEGYVVNESDFNSSGWADVPDSRAHAWVEVYLEGVGWLPIEMTPGYGGSQAIESLSEPEQQQTTQPQEQQEQQQQPEQQLPEQQEQQNVAEEQQQTEEEKSSYSWIVLCLFLAAAVVLRPWCMQQYRRWQWRRGDANQQVLRLYHYAQQLAPWQKPDSCIEQLALKARFSRQGLTEDEAGQARQAVAEQGAAIWRQAKWWQRLWLRFGLALL